MAHKLIVTHNGTFHPDDCLAVSVIKVIEERKGNTVEIVRSRKDADWARGDYVVDVGRVYDPDTNRFDHHQERGAGPRHNGIKYSSPHTKSGSLKCKFRVSANVLSYSVSKFFPILLN